MNIAERLIRGSQNIDKMRTEIRVVVSILIGQANGLGIYPDGRSCCFNFGTVLWKFQVNDMSCFIADSGNPNAPVYSSSCGGIGSLRTDQVQTVYESLPAFIEAVFKKYPELKEKFGPLLRAAQVQM